MNPLKPCGSCAEWLKKIAEVNPAFKVLSFTDSNVSWLARGREGGGSCFGRALFGATVKIILFMVAVAVFFVSFPHVLFCCH